MEKRELLEKIMESCNDYGDAAEIVIAVNELYDEVEKLRPEPKGSIEGIAELLTIKLDTPLKRGIFEEGARAVFRECFNASEYVFFAEYDNEGKFTPFREWALCALRTYNMPNWASKDELIRFFSDELETEYHKRLEDAKARKARIDEEKKGEE